MYHHTFYIWCSVNNNINVQTDNPLLIFHHFINTSAHYQTVPKNPASSTKVLYVFSCLSFTIIKVAKAFLLKWAFVILYIIHMHVWHQIPNINNFSLNYNNEQFSGTFQPAIPFWELKRAKYDLFIFLCLFTLRYYHHRYHHINKCNRSVHILSSKQNKNFLAVIDRIVISSLLLYFQFSAQI